MTSDEIKKQIQPLLPRSELFQLSVEAANAVALLEIAYQLAKFNEREEEQRRVGPDAKCKCGHVLREHAKVVTGERRCFAYGGCRCMDFTRAA